VTVLDRFVRLVVRLPVLKLICIAQPLLLLWLMPSAFRASIFAFVETISCLTSQAPDSVYLAGAETL
jgi:hypothetical protein